MDLEGRIVSIGGSATWYYYWLLDTDKIQQLNRQDTRNIINWFHVFIVSPVIKNE